MRRKQNRKLSYTEMRLMRALGLSEVSELDELLSLPIDQWAADHSEPPDEEYDLLDQACAEQERQWEAEQQFKSLFEAGYLN